MTRTFEELIDRSIQMGEPFSNLVRKNDGTYQVSCRSKYSTGMNNAFACANGLTPSDALKKLLDQRAGVQAFEETDPLS
jgi:hypothetical protein